jgi:hypothetical protein
VQICNSDPMIRLAAVLFLATALGFAETWSGYLVDSKCYATEQRNVNPFDTSPYVDSDRNHDLVACRPRPRTKSFTLVDENGLTYKLDSAGDSRAADLIGNAARKSPIKVTITGEIAAKRTIKVDSISLVR